MSGIPIIPPQVLTVMQGKPPMKWTDLCKDYMKKIKAMKPKDRLEYASFVADLLFTISKTIQGWNQWYSLEFNKPFAQNPLSEIPEDQFKLVFEFFKTIALNMLTFDIQVTEVGEKQLENAAKKKVKPKKPSKERRYVS